MKTGMIWSVPTISRTTIQSTLPFYYLAFTSTHQHSPHPLVEATRESRLRGRAAAVRGGHGSDRAAGHQAPSATVVWPEREPFPGVENQQETGAGDGLGNDGWCCEQLEEGPHNPRD